jgi:hypothetical protein
VCNIEEREREEVGEGKKEGLKRQEQIRIRNLRRQGSNGLTKNGRLKSKHIA